MIEPEHPFWAVCAEQLRAAMASAADDGDIYVLALRVLGEDDDPRRPVLAVSWNTEQHLAQRRPKSRREAGRLRWMTSSYVAQHGGYVGRGVDDLRRQWVAAIGGWWTDEDAQADEDATIEQDIATYRMTVDATITLVRDLHASGFVRETFGRAIPVLIFGQSDHDQHLRWTLLANPDKLAEQFRGYFQDEYKDG